MAVLLLFLLWLSSWTVATCLPGQKACGSTCCGSTSSCCEDVNGIRGCTPPGGSCCPFSSFGYCLSDSDCCSVGKSASCCQRNTSQCCFEDSNLNHRQWCGAMGSPCCFGGGIGDVCNATMECCQLTGPYPDYNSSCYDASRSSCCHGASSLTNVVCPHTKTSDGCCNNQYGQATCVDDITTKCCVAYKQNPSFICPAGSGCCPAPVDAGFTWSWDDACCASGQVCCTSTISLPVGSRSGSQSQPAVSKRDTPSGIHLCADPDKEFCCPYLVTIYGNLFSVSVSCPLGTLCCGGNDEDQPGGCCYGFNATTYKCDADTDGCPREGSIALGETAGVATKGNSRK